MKIFRVGCNPRLPCREYAKMDSANRLGAGNGFLPADIFCNPQQQLQLNAVNQRITEVGRVSEREDRLRSLLIGGLAGDAANYHTFLKELSAHLRAFLRVRLSGLPAEVEDLVQETLLAVHNQRHTYDVGQPLTAWVHAIARYKLVDLLRRRGTRDALYDPLDDESAVFSQSDTEASDARRDIGKLLSRLPDQQRLPIVHMKLEGLSVVEAAKLTGMSESAVKVGVHRGLKALAVMIRGEA